MINLINHALKATFEPEQIRVELVRNEELSVTQFRPVFDINVNGAVSEIKFDTAAFDKIADEPLHAVATKIIAALSQHIKQFVAHYVPVNTYDI